MCMTVYVCICPCILTCKDHYYTYCIFTHIVYEIFSVVVEVEIFAMNDAETMHKNYIKLPDWQLQTVRKVFEALLSSIKLFRNLIVYLIPPFFSCCSTLQMSPRATTSPAQEQSTVWWMYMLSLSAAGLPGCWGCDPHNPGYSWI